MSSSSFRLVVRTGPTPGTVFDLTKEVTLIGRDVTNDVVLGDPEVSRQHARLTRTPGGYVLEDLGSTNGTFVNGERLVAPRVLNPGDLVGFGENVTVTFDATAPQAAATVMGSAAQAPPVRPAPQPQPVAPVTPPPAAVAPAAPAAPAAAEEKKPRPRWLLAGCGCLVLLLAFGAFLWFMDAYYPNILYAPLRILGF